MDHGGHMSRENVSWEAFSYELKDMYERV